MSDVLITRLSTKAALHAAIVLFTLCLQTALPPRPLSLPIASNQPTFYRYPKLPVGAFHQNHSSHRAGQSPSDPTGSLFVHSH